VSNSEVRLRGHGSYSGEFEIQWNGQQGKVSE
jgi:hypothetical protein